MNKKLLIATITVALAGMTQGVYAKSDKVDVCHNGHVINIAQAALPAHLAHGDTEGACATEPTDGDSTGTEPTDGDSTGTEPTDGDSTGTEPTDGDSTGTEPTDGDSTGTEPTDGDSTDTEPLPPVDDNVIPPPEATAEEILADLLASAQELTTSTFSGGKVLMPEVQVDVLGTVVSFAVILELIPQEDGSMAFSLLGVKEVDAREGVVAATYSLTDGILVIPEIKVEAFPGEFVSFYATLVATSVDPLQLAIDLENTHPITDDATTTDPATGDTTDPATGDTTEPATTGDTTEAVDDDDAVDEPAADDEPVVGEPTETAPLAEAAADDDDSGQQI